MNPATETKPDEIPVSKQLADMFSLLKPYRFKYGFALFLRLMANVFYTALVLNIGQFVDSLMNPAAELRVGYFVLRLLALIALQALCTCFGTIQGAIVGEKIDRSLRDLFFDRTQRLTMAFHSESNTGDLIQRATSDVDEGRRFFSDHLPGIARVLFQYSTNLYALWRIDPTIALISLIIGPMILWFALFTLQKVGRVYEDYQNRESRITSDVQENLTGIRVIKAFNQQNYEYAKFDKLLEEKYQSGKGVLAAENLFWGGTDILCSVQILVSLVFSACLTVGGKISVGDFIAAMACVNLIVWPIRTMGQLIVRASRAMVSMQRVIMIIAETEEPLDTGDQLPATTPPRGKIEFRNVTFAYPGSEPTLKNVSFTVEPGQTVGILGLTGSGKTTLFNLLLRYYDCQQGQIFLDDIELARIPRTYLRREIAVVDQEPFLFGRTIAENIALGTDRPIARDEIEAAAKIAAIHDVIAGFENGYETTVGERGVTLSGGQKQRMTIARALLRDPQIILFDDATSAIDAATENRINEALARSTRRKTILSVTHRVQSVLTADLILVMKNGSLVQLGTHQTLSHEPGLYREMLNVQAQIENELEDELNRETEA